MALHNPQPLTQAIQDAPVMMTGEEAQELYLHRVVYPYVGFGHRKQRAYQEFPFHEWLTVNRVRGL